MVLPERAYEGNPDILDQKLSLAISLIQDGDLSLDVDE